MNPSGGSGVLLFEMAETTDTKDCPYCAEPVRARATICPHCRSVLGGTAAPGEAYRERPGRQIAGVSIALAEALGISVTLVRLAFIVLTFISFIGPPLYLALWLLLPAEPGGRSPLGQLLEGENGEASILERGVQKTEEILNRVAAWLRGETTSSTTSDPDSQNHRDHGESSKSTDPRAEGAP